jgi:hypothetical protein
MAKIEDPDNLTYSVNGSTGILRFDTTALTIELVEGGAFTFADGVTGQCLFSKFKLILKEDPNLNKYPLAMRKMIHDESLELLNGWKFKNTSTLKSVRDCGVAYKNSAGVITDEFACVVTLGTILTGAPYLIQTNTTDAAIVNFTHVAIGQSYGVNELIHIYQQGVFDRRNYMKVFLRAAGYTYDDASNTEIGYPTLTYKKYNFPITHSVDAGVTVDDATLDGYTGMSIYWYNTDQSASGQTGGPFNYKVIVTANGKTYQEIYSWVQRQLRKNTDIDANPATSRIGQVAPALVFMDGSTLVTIYQDTNDAYEGGVHINSPAGTSLNNIKERDNTNTLRSYPYVAGIDFEFDEFLASDGADAVFWIYDAATYPGAGAVLLKDASGNDMKGTLTGATPGSKFVKSFSYSYAGNKAWVGVAAGLSKAEITTSSGTIIESTTNKGVFASNEDKWYKNP